MHDHFEAAHPSHAAQHREHLVEPTRLARQQAESVRLLINQREAVPDKV